MHTYEKKSRTGRGEEPDKPAQRTGHRRRDGHHLHKERRRYVGSSAARARGMDRRGLPKDRLHWDQSPTLARSESLLVNTRVVPGDYIASTRNGRTTLGDGFYGRSNGPQVLAHEAVHRAQFARWPDGPVGTTRQLEEEAHRGSRALLSEGSYRARLAAAPGLTLNYTPDEQECDWEAGECVCEPQEQLCQVSPPESAAFLTHRGLVAAANAVEGIKPYLLTDISTLPQSWVPVEYLYEIGPYLIAPHATLSTPPNALYYVAYRKDLKQNEWIVGPDSIAYFEAMYPVYEGVGNRMTSGGPHRTPSPGVLSTVGDPTPSSSFVASGAISAYDSHLRIEAYVEPARELAEDMIAQVDAGEIDHMTGRQRAAKGRNSYLRETRSRLSPGALAMSHALKEEGMTVEQLTEKYAGRRAESLGISQDSPDYQRRLRELGESPEVSRTIMQKAGEPNRWMTRFARLGRVAGPMGSGVGAILSVREVVNAEEGRQLHVAARELGGFAGGAVGAVGGGLAGAWTASLLCGPAAVGCAVVVSVVIVGAASFAGGTAGGYAGESLADYGGLLPLAMPMHSLSAGGGRQRFIDRDRQELLRATQPYHMTLRQEMHEAERRLREVDVLIADTTDHRELEELRRTRVHLLMYHDQLSLQYRALMVNDRDER